VERRGTPFCRDGLSYKPVRPQAVDQLLRHCCVLCCPALGLPSCIKSRHIRVTRLGANARSCRSLPPRRNIWTSQGPARITPEALRPAPPGCGPHPQSLRFISAQRFSISPRASSSGSRMIKPARPRWAVRIDAELAASGRVFHPPWIRHDYITVWR